MSIRQLPEQEERVETGPIQFGNDWPGVFVRGDSAGWYAFQLKRLIESQDYEFPFDVELMLRNLHSDMIGAVEGPSAGLVALGENHTS